MKEKKGFTFIDSIVHIRAVARDIVSDVLLHGYINHLGNFFLVGGEFKERKRKHSRKCRDEKTTIKGSKEQHFMGGNVYHGHDVHQVFLDNNNFFKYTDILKEFRKSMMGNSRHMCE